MKLISTLLLVILVNEAIGAFHITEHSPDITVKEGSDIELYCKISDDGTASSNDDWKVCKWIRGKDSAKCTITYDCDGPLCGIGVGKFSHTVHCDKKLFDSSFFGENPNISNHLCGLKVPNVDRRDKTTWRCEIEECRVTGCGTHTGNSVIVKERVKVKVLPKSKPTP